MTTEIEHWQTMQKLLRGYRTTQIIVTCNQLGVFRQLAAGPQTAPELALKIEAEPQALARLLNAAAALNLLTRQGEVYANTPLVATCLAEEGPYFLGNFVRREAVSYQRWGHLREAVRTGQRPEVNLREEDRANWVHKFESALMDQARPISSHLAEALALPTGRPVRVLDVGGGHGEYSMALARHYPNVQATVFELPAAGEVARDMIARAGMSDRVTVQVGNFQQEKFKEGFDLILLFGILVSETLAGQLALLRNCYEALVPGGRVAIREFWFNEDRTGPPEVALFSLSMLLSNNVGDVSTLSELESRLDEAGFVQPHLIELPEWIGSGLLVAHKPA